MHKLALKRNSLTSAFDPVSKRVDKAITGKLSTEVLQEGAFHCPRTGQDCQKGAHTTVLFHSRTEGAKLAQISH